MSILVRWGIAWIFIINILFNIFKSHYFFKFSIKKVLKAGWQSLSWFGFQPLVCLSPLQLGWGRGTPRTPAPRSQEPESETASAGFTCLKTHHQKQINDGKQLILVSLTVFFSIHYRSLTSPPSPAFCRKIKVIFVAWGRNVNMLSIWELGFCEIFPFLIIPQIKQMDQFTKILESLHIHNLKS